MAAALLPIGVGKECMVALELLSPMARAAAQGRHRGAGGHGDPGAAES